jgi:hypothetical protein
MTQVRVAATLKATGLNILRSAAFRIRKRRRYAGKSGDDSTDLACLGLIKERFKHITNNLMQLSEVFRFDIYRLEVCVA